MKKHQVIAGFVAVILVAAAATATAATMRSGFFDPNRTDRQYVAQRTNGRRK